MKFLLSTVLFAALSISLRADIQDPPQNDFGPTRKLGRGISNILWSASEIPESANQINDRLGNSAGFSYGLERGIARMLFRISMGVYEVVTFPFPNAGGTYEQPYIRNIPWIHGGLEEFPPELGFETRYDYVRKTTVY